ncbi:conserved protein of unknown function [Methylocella tundrae]|uniref:Uncharacterized protein n=1 Tax=Methylocella tundrae TaxID=227605 RepID=A0A4U8YVS3_METTU|nr:conserved protein of unknown function [Methylocella tundrae]
MPSGGAGLLLEDLSLDGEGAGRKFGVVGLDEERVEAAAMLDRPQGRSGDAKAELALQHVGDQRDVAKVRQETRPRLMVRMADQIAGLYGLAGQIAAAGHLASSSNSKRGALGGP